jgi:hypothetical protein
MEKEMQSEPLPVVRNMVEISAHDGELVSVFGEYRAIPMPEKGGSSPGAPLEYAVVVLADGTRVFLESYNTPAAVRSSEERQRLNHKEVIASGVIHRFMPLRGQGLMEPSINDIQTIVERTLDCLGNPAADTRTTLD